VTWCLGGKVFEERKRGRAEEGASFGQRLNASGEMRVRQINIRLSQDFLFII
jgi:hypothetical protein